MRLSVWCPGSPVEGSRLWMSHCAYVGQGYCTADPGAAGWPLPKSGILCLCLVIGALCHPVESTSVFVQLGVKSISTQNQSCKLTMAHSAASKRSRSRTPNGVFGLSHFFGVGCLRSGGHSKMYTKCGVERSFLADNSSAKAT